MSHHQKKLVIKFYNKLDTNHLNENTNAESINNNNLTFRLNTSRNDFIQFPLYYFNLNNNIEDEDEEYDNFDYVYQMQLGTNAEEVFNNLGNIINIEK